MNAALGPQHEPVPVRSAWRTRLRWLVRAVCLAAAVALLWPAVAAERGPAWVPALSPFIGIASVLASRALPALAWLGLAVAAIALVRHRWFCRWVCPTGLCADGATRLGRLAGRRYARGPALGAWILLLTWGGAILGYPLLLWLDPLAVFAGPLRLGAKHGDWAAWYGAALLPAVILLGLIWPNVWCGQLCPLGALQDLLVRLPRSWWREKGVRNHLCEAPAGPVPGKRFLTPFSRTRLARRSLLMAACGVVWAGATRWVRGATPRPLRPPGAVDELTFLGLCVRCGNCTRSCPVGILAADSHQHGVAGWLAPVVRFETDYCREDCVRCTAVCPSGALVPLPLEDKPKARIGLPVVDMNVCLLADERECAACRSHCPYEAIRYVFSEVEYTLTPQVDPQRCNGCGACQLACPTQPVKAIVVHPAASGPAVATLTK